MCELSLSLSNEDLPKNIAVNEIGLFRPEYIIRQISKDITSKEAREAIIGRITELLNYQPGAVWYRLTDMLSTDYINFCDKNYSIYESDPMLGERGVRRYIKYPELLKYEIDIFQKVKSSRLNLILPMVTSLEQVDYIVDCFHKEGFEGEIGIMLEIPATVFNIDVICKAIKPSRVIIGMNDLTSYALGCDRNSVNFDICHPGITELINITQHKISSLPITLKIAGHFNQFKSIDHLKGKTNQLILRPCDLGLFI